MDGFLNQALFSIDDGVENTYFLGNNDIDDTLLHIEAVAPFYPNWLIAWNVALNVLNFSSDTFNQVGQDSTNLIYIRSADVKLRSEEFGTLYVGYGDTASDNTAEVDLTAIVSAQYSEVQDTGYSFYFRNSDGTLNGVTIGDAFNNLDGLGRANRIRYDTPNFFHFAIFASVIQGDQADISLNYQRAFTNFQLAAAVAYAKTFTPYTKIQQHIIDGSFSVLFNNGINVTGAAGRLNTKVLNQNNGNTYYIKLGYQRQFIPLGISTVSVDTGRYYNFSSNDAKGTTYSVAAMQYIDAWNTQIYCAWRQFRLRQEPTLKNINAVFAGIRINFYST